MGDSVCPPRLQHQDAISTSRSQGARTRSSCGIYDSSGMEGAAQTGAYFGRRRQQTHSFQWGNNWGNNHPSPTLPAFDLLLVPPPLAKPKSWKNVVEMGLGRGEYEI